MDDSQTESQLMGAGSGHDTFVLLKSLQGNTSQAYSLEKSTPKQWHNLHQMQFVPTIRSCRNAVFLSLYTRMRPSTGFNQKRL